MINNVILVGRLAKDPELREVGDGKNVTEITIAVTRPFKNPVSLEYETDFIKCTLWDQMAINTHEYCKKGSTVGIKGRVSVRQIQINSQMVEVIELIAEKITFISKKE